MLPSGASHHIEFKSVEGSLFYWEGQLCLVPDSRQAIFKDRTLGLAEKREMMKFLKLVQQHIGSGESEVAAVVEERLLGYRQRIWTSRLLNSLRSSISLPQAFCRCAAVKGALYVLRMPVVALLMDKESGQYKGVNLASGQDISSHHLVMEPSFQVPSPVSHSNIVCEGLNTSNLAGYVVRGVSITTGPIQQGSSNILVVFPPKSLYDIHAIRLMKQSETVL